MFVRVAALCLRSTVLPTRRELGFAERSVLPAGIAALTAGPGAICWRQSGDLEARPGQQERSQNRRMGEQE